MESTWDDQEVFGGVIHKGGPGLEYDGTGMQARYASLDFLLTC